MHDDDANAAGMNLSGSRNRLTRWIFDEEDSTQDNRQQTAFAVTRPAAAPVATSTTLGDNHADRASRRRCWVLVDTSPWGAEDDHSGGGGGGGARTEEFRNARLRMRRAGAEGQWRSYGSRSKCVFTETGAAAVLASGAAAPRRAAPGWQDGAAESRRRGTVGFELNAVVQAHKQTAPPFATDSVPLSKGDGFGLRVSGQQLMLEQSESGEWWDVHRRWRLRGGRPPRSEVSGDPAATHVVVVLELRGTRLYSLDDDRLGGAWDWALVELQPPAGERVEVRLDGPAYGRRAASVAHLGNLVGRTLVFQKTRMRSDELAEGGDGEGDGTKKNGSANTTDICLSVGDAHHHKGTMRFGNGTARVLPVSALFRDQIVRVLSSGKPEVVNHRAIRALTNELWDKFALRYYVLQMVLYLLLVVAYTAALLHPDTVGLTLVCMLVAGVNSAFEISQLLAVGAVEYLLSSGNFFDNLVLVVVQLTLMGNMAYALSGTAQDRWWMALCAIVNLLTWVKLCLFWGAFELTGPYLRMITAMVRKMGEFLVVCTYFIVAFAAVSWFGACGVARAYAYPPPSPGLPHRRALVPRLRGLREQYGVALSPRDERGLRLRGHIRTRRRAILPVCDVNVTAAVYFYFLTPLASQVRRLHAAGAGADAQHSHRDDVDELRGRHAPRQGRPPNRPRPRRRCRPRKHHPLRRGLPDCPRGDTRPRHHGRQQRRAFTAERREGLLPGGTSQDLQPL